MKILELFVTGIWWSGVDMARDEDVQGPSPLIKINVTAIFPQEDSSRIKADQDAHRDELIHSSTRLLVLTKC